MSQKTHTNGKKTQDPYVNYLREIREIDTEDPNLHEKVNSAMRRHGVVPSDRRYDSYESRPEVRSDDTSVVRRRKQPVVEEGDDMFSFFTNPFEQLHMHFKNIWRTMDRQFENSDVSTDFEELEKEMPNEDPTTYCKYVQNVTSYENGVRKSKSISGVDKQINGKHYMSKRMVMDDGVNVTTKHVYPDGRELEQKAPSKKRIEYKKTDEDK
jgi:hypothetical protein